ncbi:hypothetical protein L917_00608 [Phytophthora nicotianae]|uniref:Uncharacterized protein n=1 Tax=Phytophthora nicotianae TaxID=4792 RepID=W2M0E9_PHYNI|nr:hypothetical protein L917_00608 [Phytophthora nicotianae]
MGTIGFHRRCLGFDSCATLRSRASDIERKEASVGDVDDLHSEAKIRRAHVDCHRVFQSSRLKPQSWQIGRACGPEAGILMPHEFSWCLSLQRHIAPEAQRHLSDFGDVGSVHQLPPPAELRCEWHRYPYM